MEVNDGQKKGLGVSSVIPISPLFRNDKFETLFSFLDKYPADGGVGFFKNDWKWEHVITMTIGWFVSSEEMFYIRDLALFLEAVADEQQQIDRNFVMCPHEKPSVGIIIPDQCSVCRLDKEVL